MAEQLGNQAINQRVAGSIPGRVYDVKGKTLNPTCLWECPCTQSLWIRTSAKSDNVNYK